MAGTKKFIEQNGSNAMTNQKKARIWIASIFSVGLVFVLTFILDATYFREPTPTHPMSERQRRLAAEPPPGGVKLWGVAHVDDACFLRKPTCTEDYDARVAYLVIGYTTEADVHDAYCPPELKGCPMHTVLTTRNSDGVIKVYRINGPNGDDEYTLYFVNGILTQIVE